MVDEDDNSADIDAYDSQMIIPFNVTDDQQRATPHIYRSTYAVDWLSEINVFAITMRSSPVVDPDSHSIH